MHFCPAWKPMHLLLKFTNFQMPLASTTAPLMSLPEGLTTDVLMPPSQATMSASVPSILAYSKIVRTVGLAAIGVVLTFVRPSRAARRPLLSMIALVAEMAYSGDSSAPD